MHHDRVGIVVAVDAGVGGADVGIEADAQRIGLRLGLGQAGSAEAGEHDQG
ncbi:hypothetical protein D3C78_1636920 [compost metagenome]